MFSSFVYFVTQLCLYIFLFFYKFNVFYISIYSIVLQACSGPRNRPKTSNFQTPYTELPQIAHMFPRIPYLSSKFLRSLKTPKLPQIAHIFTQNLQILRRLQTLTVAASQGDFQVLLYSTFYMCNFTCCIFNAREKLGATGKNIVVSQGL